ncbi:MAG: hypothetical protein AAFO69_04920 [Bacteroidota bacterium]
MYENYPNKLDTKKTLTIANTAAKSNELAIHGGLVGLYIPSDFQGSSLTFEGAPLEDSTFYPVHDGANNVVGKAVTAGTFVKLDPIEFAGISRIKITSDQNQNQDIEIIAALRPL